MPLSHRIFWAYLPPDDQPLSARPVPERSDLCAEQGQFQLHVQVRRRIHWGPLSSSRPLSAGEEPVSEWRYVPGAVRRLSMSVRTRVRGRPVPERGGLLRSQTLCQRWCVRESEERLPVQLSSRVRREGLQPVRERVRVVPVRQRWDMRDRQQWRLQVRVPRRLYGRQLHRRAAHHSWRPIQTRVRPGTARNGAGVRQRPAHGRVVRSRSSGRVGRHRGGAVHEEPPAP